MQGSSLVQRAAMALGGVAIAAGGLGAVGTFSSEPVTSTESGATELVDLVTALDELAVALLQLDESIAADGASTELARRVGEVRTALAKAPEGSVDKVAVRAVLDSLDPLLVPGADPPPTAQLLDLATTVHAHATSVVGAVGGDEYAQVHEAAADAARDQVAAAPPAVGSEQPRGTTADGAEPAAAPDPTDATAPPTTTRVVADPAVLIPNLATLAAERATAARVPASSGSALPWIALGGVGLAGMFLGRASAQRRHTDETTDLVRKATTDPLTGVLNRSGLDALIERRQTNPASVGILYLDLDGFKDVNDRLGHAAGDELLVQFADRIQGVLRPSDELVRVGGDEFVVVLPGVERQQAGIDVGLRLVSAMSTPFRINDEDLAVTASVGFSFGTHADDINDVIRDADAALFTAKRLGKNRISWA